MTLVAAVSLSAMSGDDLQLEFTVTQDEDAVSIAGMTVRFVVARAVGDTPVLTTEGVSPTATIDATDAAQGIFVVDVAGEDTEDLSGTYRFEAEIEDGQGAKSTVSRGYITFQDNMI